MLPHDGDEPYTTLYSIEVPQLEALQGVELDAADAQYLLDFALLVRRQGEVRRLYGPLLGHSRSVGLLCSGPPGTGKTLVASLVAAMAGVALLHARLEEIVSKYVGDTEKKIKELFEAAVLNGGIVFIDEADALVAERTHVTSANDRHANSAVNQLLQQIERFAVAVIIATNKPANVDEAFRRRFQYQLCFRVPSVPIRRRMWLNWLARTPGGDRINVDWIVHHRFTGANIKNVFLRVGGQLLEAGESPGANLGVLLDKEIQREHAMRSGYPYDYYDLAEDCGCRPDGEDPESGR